MANAQELFELAVAAHQNGDLEAAEQGYREAIRTDSCHAGAMTNLGVLLARKGKLEDAATLYAASVAIEPNSPDTHFNLGNLSRRLGRLPEAVTAYEAVLALVPNHAPAHLNLGLAVSDLGDWPRAVTHFREAVKLNPELTEGFNLLWEALTRVGRHEEALEAIREFVRRRPDDPRGRLNLGLTLTSTNKGDEAITELELALKLRPDYPEAHNALGIALDSAGRHDDAVFQYREAVRLRPDFADAWTNLGVSLTEVGRIRESTEAVTKAYELQPTHHLGSNRLLTLLGSSSITAEQLREAHQSWAVKHADPLTPEPGSIRYPDPGPRLKVGYVFDLIHTGATFGFLQSLLTRHDRNRVHVTCYPNAISPSHGTDQLRRLADVWRPIVELPSAQAAETIRADEIDVLVDLWGHYGGNRLLVFARKPARVQLSLFGYPCATGLKAIDFRVTDALADPAGSEPVLRLPNVGRLYVPPLFVPKPNPLPVSSRRTFTFGCLANPARLSEQCLDTWARVLKVVPRSRLVLRTGRSAEAARELTERFTRAGVASDRLEFVFHADEVSYFEAYQPIDAVLDPFPFNGRATTCDALWMGVPVLTVAGTESRSRQGLSILTNIGLADFVADSPEKFVELAATWAEQRDALAELREGLREMVAASPVTDAEAFTRHLEAAYRTAVS